jgi:hypothetical protein
LKPKLQGPEVKKEEAPRKTGLVEAAPTESVVLKTEPVVPAPKVEEVKSENVPKPSISPLIKSDENKAQTKDATRELAPSNQGTTKEKSEEHGPTPVAKPGGWGLLKVANIMKAV